MLRGSVTESAANTFTEANLPTPNMTEAGYVMEVLRIYFEIEGDLNLTDGDKLSIAVYENSVTALPYYDDSGVILKWKYVAGVVASGANKILLTYTQDYTDGAGNGLLVGRKEIKLGIEGLSQTNALKANFAILYRLVKVSPAELVGLISS